MAESRQPRFTEDQSIQIFRAIERWVDEANLKAPYYSPNSRPRDKWLREFWPREPLISGVLRSVQSIDANRGWEITGGRNLVSTYTNVFRWADGGAGWRPFCSRQSLSFYTADMCSVAETATDVEGGALTGLYHVDPARCQLSGKVETPLYYYPSKGKRQEWKPDYFFRSVAMPSTDEEMNGLGYCSLSGCLDLATIMIAMYRHDQEMLFAKMPKGMLLMKGINDGQWADAMESQAEELTAKERQFYAGLSIFFGDQDMDAKLVALSNLPSNFNMKEWTDLLMAGYALIFGYDLREFWAVSTAAMGTAAETEVQHQKATGKGGLNFALAFQDNLQRRLPGTIHFEFLQRDEAGEILEAQVAEAWAKAINQMALPAGSGPETLSVEERRQLLAAHGLIPEDWTLEEEEAAQTDTDTERAMSSIEVHRSLALQPDEPIIRYSWPTGRVKVIYDKNNRPRRFFLMNQKKERTIAQITMDYRDRLNNIVYRAFNTIKNSGYSPKDVLKKGIKAQVRDDIKALIRSRARDAYVEGLREGGVSAEDMDDDDMAEIESWKSEQLGFVNDFAGAIVEAAGNDDEQESILARVDYWVRAIETLGLLGTASAKKNMMVTWKMGNTQEHCSTCLRLNGKRHRLKWFTKINGYIPRQVGSETLECGGWACECRLEDDDGTQIL